MNKALIIALLAACSLSASAASRSVNYAAGELSDWGTQRAEAYDIAILLRDPILVGSRICSIEVPALAVEGTSAFSLWLSKDLKLSKNVNQPDIATYTPEIATSEDGRATVSIALPEAYTIGEEGVYVGLSFKVDALNDVSRLPLRVSESINPDAFFIHTSRTYMKWGNYDLGYAANIRVILSGEFVENAVEMLPMPESGALKGENMIVSVPFRNTGTEAVSSMEYSYTVNGVTSDGKLIFEEPLPAQFDSEQHFDLCIDGIATAGAYPSSVICTMVNGKPNNSQRTEAEGMLYSYPYLPVHRPLVEDYTATWCGWCPAGTVSMEVMGQTYPDDFVAIAVHHDDVMSLPVFTEPREYPGAPAAFIDRRVWAHPYKGAAEHEDFQPSPLDGFGVLWNEVRSHIAPADLSLTAQWTDKERTAIECTASAAFVRQFKDADLRLWFTLAADGLKYDSKSWQSNYFSGGKAYEGTAMEPWTLLPTKVDTVYDHVAVYSTLYEGLEASLPSDIDMEQVCEHKHIIDMADAPLVQNKDKLCVVCAVIDNHTGAVLNAAKALVEDHSGIGSVEAPATEYRYYTLEGLPASGDKPGIYIRVATGAGGTHSSVVYR